MGAPLTWETLLPYILGVIVTAAGAYVRYRSSKQRITQERAEWILSLQKQLTSINTEMTQSKQDCLGAIDKERQSRRSAEFSFKRLELTVKSLQSQEEEVRSENLRLTSENSNLLKENLIINEVVLTNQVQIQTMLNNLETVITRALVGINQLMTTIEGTRSHAGSGQPIVSANRTTTEVPPRSSAD